MRSRPLGTFWLIAMLTLVSVATKVCCKQDPLIAAFRKDLKNGITFFFFFSPDEGMFATLQGTKITIRFKDGARSDDGLTSEVVRGSFTVMSTRLTLHSDCLRHDLVVTIKPLGKLEELRKNRGYEHIKFRLEGEDVPFGGIGPVDMEVLTGGNDPLKGR